MTKKRTIDPPGNDDTDLCLAMVAAMLLLVGFGHKGVVAADDWYREWSRPKGASRGDACIQGTIEEDGNVYVDGPGKLTISDADITALELGGGVNALQFDNDPPGKAVYRHPDGRIDYYENGRLVRWITPTCRASP